MLIQTIFDLTIHINCFKQDLVQLTRITDSPPSLLSPQVMVEAYRRDATSKEQLISELKSTKKRLLAEVKDLKQELLAAQGEKQSAALEQSRLQKEVVRVQEQMSSLEAHLQAIQLERDQLESQIQVGVHGGNHVSVSVLDGRKNCCVGFSPLQSLQFDRNQLAAVTDENESLRKQVEQMEGEAKK